MEQWKLFSWSRTSGVWTFHFPTSSRWIPPLFRHASDQNRFRFDQWWWPVQSKTATTQLALKTDSISGLKTSPPARRFHGGVMFVEEASGRLCCHAYHLLTQTMICWHLFCSPSITDTSTKKEKGAHVFRITGQKVNFNGNCSFLRCKNAQIKASCFSTFLVQ